MSGTADFHAGRKVGKYEILTLLSMGGMAELFLGYTAGPGGFRKFVALKQILPDIKKDESFVKMFLDEARITAAFSHSNIGQVFELGEEQGELYLAMEFISGQNLEQVVRSARKGQVEIPVGFAAMSVRDTCLGLHYAHHFVEPSGKPAPVVHRDVSPKNVMVTYDGHVKVIDFGIAKAKGRLNRTQAGMVKGTTGYMSPEQVRNEQLDGRSDLFSAAVMLHELLVGRRLFDGPTDAATMIQIVEAEIPSPRSLNPKVPEALSQVVMKALSREREQRYATGKELARAIDAAMGEHFDEDDASAFMQGLFAEKVQKTRALLDLATRDDGELARVAEKLREEAPEPAAREAKPRGKGATPGARESAGGKAVGRESVAGKAVGRESSTGRDPGREGGGGREAGRESGAGRDAGRESSAGRTPSGGRSPSGRVGTLSPAGRDSMRESQRLSKPAPRPAPSASSNSSSTTNVSDEAAASDTPAPRHARTPPGRRPPPPSRDEEDEKTPSPRDRFKSSVAESYGLYSEQEEDTAQSGGVTAPRRPVNTSVLPALSRAPGGGPNKRRWFSVSKAWLFLLVLVGAGAFGTTKLEGRFGEIVRPHYLKAEAWALAEFGDEPPPPATTSLRPGKPKGPPPPQAQALLGEAGAPGDVGAEPAGAPGANGAGAGAAADSGAVGAAAKTPNVKANANAAGSSTGVSATGTTGASATGGATGVGGTSGTQTSVAASAAKGRTPTGATSGSATGSGQGSASSKSDGAGGTAHAAGKSGAGTGATAAKAAAGAGATTDPATSVTPTEVEVEVLDTRNAHRAAEDGLGWLTLYTVPPAYVYDGSTQLGTTPLVKVPLPEGTYRLRLMDSESKYRTLSAPIKPGKVTDLRIRVSDLPLDPSQD